MLGQRHRRWPNTKTLLFQHVAFSGYVDIPLFIVHVHAKKRFLWDATQVAKTVFSHRLTAQKIVGHFFVRSYLRLALE